MRAIRQHTYFFAAAGAMLFLFMLATGGAIIIERALAQTATTSSSTETTAQKQQDLENQLAALQTQIDQYQGQITVDQQKGTTLTGRDQHA